MTTPVIPGRRVSSGWTIMSQIEVPITTTNVPGSSTPTPGTDTHASTFPTATATDSVSPMLLRHLRPQRARLRPERHERVA